MPAATFRSLTCALCLLATAPAWAGYSQAVAAYGRGAYDVAAREFRAEAEAGDAESAYMLGRLYELGAGVPQDWLQAWAWHERAARQGHRMARESRENLEAILTRPQLAGARALLAPERVEVVALPPVAEPSIPPVGRRQVVIILRNGPPARLAAPAATYEGFVRSAGTMGQQVRLLQRELNREGYFAGPVDGRMGALTRQAVRSYQIDHGLAADGRLTGELLDLLTAPEPQKAEGPPGE